MVTVRTGMIVHAFHLSDIAQQWRLSGAAFSSSPYQQDNQTKSSYNKGQFILHLPLNPLTAFALEHEPRGGVFTGTVAYGIYLQLWMTAFFRYSVAGCLCSVFRCHQRPYKLFLQRRYVTSVLSHCHIGSRAVSRRCFTT